MAAFSLQCHLGCSAGFRWLRVHSVPIKTTIQGVHSLLYENKGHDFIVALEVPENYQNTIQLPHTFLFPTDN